MKASEFSKTKSYLEKWKGLANQLGTNTQKLEMYNESILALDRFYKKSLKKDDIETFKVLYSDCENILDRGFFYEARYDSNLSSVNKKMEDHIDERMFVFTILKDVLKNVIEDFLITKPEDLIVENHDALELINELFENCKTSLRLMSRKENQDSQTAYLVINDFVISERLMYQWHAVFKQILSDKKQDLSYSSLLSYDYPNGAKTVDESDSKWNFDYRGDGLYIYEDNDAAEIPLRSAVYNEKTKEVFYFSTNRVVTPDQKVLRFD